MQHSDINMIKRGIESCLFSILSGKTDSSEVMNSQNFAGGLVGSPQDMLDFVRPILKNHVLKLIYFHQLNGSRSFKTSVTYLLF